jgi:hypothetical protein
LAIRHRLQRRAQALHHFGLRRRLASGKNLAHYRTLQALPIILGAERQADADYLDTCRAKRNTAEYDAPGQVSAKEAKELAAFARELREVVVAWLETKHPTLSPWSA